jgi:hypothetical protein
MAKFGISSVSVATATGYKTLLRAAPTATGCTSELVYIGIFGAGAVTPASVEHELVGTHLDATTTGTLTAFTPARFWRAFQAARGTYGINATVEPTVYAAEFPIAGGFNQLNGYMWGVPEGQGLKADAAPDTFDNVGVRIRSSVAGAIDFNFHVIEP